MFMRLLTGSVLEIDNLNVIEHPVTINFPPSFGTFYDFPFLSQTGAEFTVVLFTQMVNHVSNLQLIMRHI